MSVIPENVHIIDVIEVGESMRRFTWPDYVVFVVMLIVCGLTGVYWGYFKKQNSAQDYLMGGRNMSTFPVSLSLVASYISGISLLGTPTEIYVYGIQYMYVSIGIILMTLVVYYIYLPVFHDLKLTSLYEYLERRYNKKLRLFGSVLFTISIIKWLPIVIYVPALAFNQVTGVNIHIITPVVCVVCIYYTCVGGLQAVVWTDVIQTFVMFGAMLLVIIKGSVEVGGMGVVLQRNWDSGRIEAPNFDPNPLSRHTIWTMVIGGAVHWTVATAVSQTMVQRYMSLPNLKSARRALCYFTVGILIIMWLCCYSGMLIYAKYHSCDPLTTQLAKAKDQLLPLLMMDVLRDLPGLPGLFMAGVFSAALSSLSTGLNSMAAVILEDFYKTYSSKPLTERQTNILMKTVVLSFGILCVGLVFVVEHLGTVLQLSQSLSGITQGPILAIFTAGLLLPWVNSEGAITGGVVGLILMGWICLGAQTAIAKGDLYFEEKPVNTEGCLYTYTPKISRTTAMSLIRENSSNIILNDYQHADEVFMLYRLSYMWYTLLGCVLSTTIALVVSLLYHPNDLQKIDKRLFPPFIQKIIEKKNKQSNGIKVQLSSRSQDEGV